MRTRIALLFIAACFFNVVTTGATDSFHLGYSYFKPYIWNENNTHKGIYVDVLTEALEKRMGIPRTIFNPS